MKTTTTENITTSPIPIDEFPILEHGLYANHAAIGPWPRAASQAVVEFARENCEIGAEKYNHWLTREQHLRKNLAGLLNADSPEDIALLKNTTEGICIVASGIDWRSGDNVVLPAGEFPSNRLPWLALQRFGVDVREVDIRSRQDPEQALLARMDKRTRLLSVSAVQWTDGLRLRLEVLGAACRQNDTLFFVDAIQQLGAMQMDVQACGIVRESLQLGQLGWHMVDEPYQFNRDQWQPSKTATRFEAGSPNTLGQVALHASVSLLQNVGMQQVEAYIKANSAALSAGIADIPGLELVRPFDRQRISGIVSFRIPDRGPVEIHRALQKRQLSCAVRGDAIRLSPHFYQAGEPLQEILAVIEDVITYKSN